MKFNMGGQSVKKLPSSTEPRSTGKLKVVMKKMGTSDSGTKHYCVTSSKLASPAAKKELSTSITHRIIHTSLKINQFFLL